MNIIQIEQELSKLDQQRRELTAKLSEAHSRTYAKCEKCGKRSQLQKLTFVQTHFYIQPTGCTEGDYWKAGEGYFECSRCKHINRLCNRKALTLKKRYFGKQEETHGEQLFGVPQQTAVMMGPPE